MIFDIDQVVMTTNHENRVVKASKVARSIPFFLFSHHFFFCLKKFFSISSFQRKTTYLNITLKYKHKCGWIITYLKRKNISYILGEKIKYKNDEIDEIFFFRKKLNYREGKKGKYPDVRQVSITTSSLSSFFHHHYFCPTPTITGERKKKKSPAFF